MESTARRTYLVLRQHPLLLSGPWLVVSAVGFIVTKIVDQILILNRLYPMSAAGSINMDAALSNSLIRQVAISGVLLMEGAFNVIALALTILLAKQLATQGRDTFSAALERLRKMPSVAGILLKFYAIVLLLELATSLVVDLPVILYEPLTMSMNMSPHSLRWVFMVSADVGRLLFVVCVVQVVLRLVFRLQRPSLSSVEIPAGMLPRAIGYGALAFGIEVTLGLLMRPLQRPLVGTPPISALIGPSLIGLATNLIATLPTIACIVAIALMVAGTVQPLTDGEPA